TKPLNGLDEVLIRPLTQFEICGNDLFHYVGDLPVRYRRSQQGAELRPFVSPASKRDLVELLAVLLAAQNADMPDVMMGGGSDSSRNIDMQPTEIAGEIEIAKTTTQFLRNRYGAGIGEAAVIKPRASNYVGDQTHIRRCDPDPV